VTIKRGLLKKICKDINNDGIDNHLIFYHKNKTYFSFYTYTQKKTL